MANIGDKYISEAEYQRGLNDAWRIIQKVFRYVEDGGMPLKELEKAFGTGDLGKLSISPSRKR